MKKCRFSHKVDVENQILKRIPLTEGNRAKSAKGSQINSGLTSKCLPPADRADGVLFVSRDDHRLIRIFQNISFEASRSVTGGEITSAKYCWTSRQLRTRGKRRSFTL